VQAINYETAWRDPYVFYHEPDASFYAFLCARVAGGGDVGGGCIAVARSDNLLDWTLLPPAYRSDTLTCLEVPEYFNLNGRHYLTYTTSYHFGTPYPVRDAHQVTGSFYLVSDTMLAGYHPPAISNALNASAPSMMTTYVGRSIAAPDNNRQRLYYYHHVFPGAPGEGWTGSFAAPKVLEESGAGQLVLRYDPALFAGHLSEPVAIVNPLTSDSPLDLALHDAPDGMYEARVAAPYAGICFRMNPTPEGDIAGLAVWLAPESPAASQWYVMLGGVHFSGGPRGLRPALGTPVALRRLEPGWHRQAFPHVHLRVISRDVFVDVYVDDVLCLSHTYAASMIPATGHVGAFYAGHPKQSAIHQFTAHRFKP